MMKIPQSVSGLVKFAKQRKSELIIASLCLVLLYLGYRVFVKGGGNLMNQLNVNDFNLPMMNNVELFSGDGNNNDIPNNEKEVSMVKFYAPWCGHCKNMASTWEKFEGSYNGKTINGKKINIIEVNGDEKGDLTKKYQVNGFPTIKMFAGGKTLDFEGERTYDAFESFLKNNLN